MDFFKKALDGGDESTQNQNPSEPSKADLLSSAKLVAAAGQAQFQNKPSDVDKRELAGASAKLLGAAQKYGKLDENQGVGQYVEKAEDYLRGYSQSQSHSSATTAPSKDGAAGEAVGEHVEKAEGILKQSGDTAGEGVGEYAEKAEEFLKKQSSGESHETPAGGAGDFTKMAGDFLKRD